jgi:hypothetical protein
MKNTNPIRVRLGMRVGRYRGESMSMLIKANDTVIVEYTENEISGDRLTIDFECAAPMILDIEVNGKNVNDTMVGPSGEILEDKCVVVENMSVDRIWLKKWYLESRAFEFQHNTGTNQNTNYFGQNGRARFRIHTEDLLEFWLDTMCVDD